MSLALGTPTSIDYASPTSAAGQCTPSTHFIFSNATKRTIEVESFCREWCPYRSTFPLDYQLIYKFELFPLATSECSQPAVSTSTVRERWRGERRYDLDTIILIGCPRIDTYTHLRFRWSSVVGTTKRNQTLALSKTPRWFWRNGDTILVVVLYFSDSRLTPGTINYDSGGSSLFLYHKVTYLYLWRVKSDRKVHVWHHFPTSGTCFWYDYVL